MKGERERLKTLSQLCAEAQRDVNKLVRLRDAEKGCISCPSPRIDDAGHLFPIGSKFRTSRIRFDVRLINGQCAKCNRYTGGGNREGYEAGYVARFGQGALEIAKGVKLMAERGELPPLTRGEVREIGAEARRKCREMTVGRFCGNETYRRT